VLAIALLFLVGWVRCSVLAPPPPGMQRLALAALPALPIRRPCSRSARKPRASNAAVPIADRSVRPRP
jgi:hypothetical protein